MTEEPKKRTPRKHNPAWADNTRTERNKRHNNLRRERNQAIALAAGYSLPPVQLAKSLPCAIRKPNTDTVLCGKPAYVAYCEAYFDNEVPGRFLIQPVCESCAKAAAARYKVG